MALGLPKALAVVCYQLCRRKMVMDDRLAVVEEAAEAATWRERLENLF